jgi:predicted neuraminidase
MHFSFSAFIFLVALAGGLLRSAAPGLAQSAKTSRSLLVSEEFIFENPSFPECHASTIVELSGGRLLASWFGGTHERHPDVTIWTATHENGRWSPPVSVADGVIDDTLRYPCWNPVLFKSNQGRLSLFYKVGPSPQEWWGMVIHSADEGKTWSAPEKLPDGVLGPIKNKPVQLANGTILSPSSTESEAGWRAHVEKSTDQGKTWQVIPVSHQSSLDVIQPSILLHSGNRLQVLCRSRQNAVVESWSEDGGNTWGPLAKTRLPNPNSGTDALTLQNGMHLLVYNPTIRGEEWSKGRNKLNVAISGDGKNWRDIYQLVDEKDGEYSYPAVIQTADSRIHITYTWQRKNIRHVVLNVPERVQPVSGKK